MILRTMLLVLALVFGGALRAEAALSCNAKATPIDFGSVSLRRGAVTATSGAVEVRCSGLLDVVGVCIRLGPGSGGAGAGSTPRYMRHADGTRLGYNLRSGGNGPPNPVWTEIYTTIQSLLLVDGLLVIPVYADLAGGADVETGAYATQVSGILSYNVRSCNQTGMTAAIPNFAVRANIAPSCDVDGGALDFGALDPMATDQVDAVGNFTVRCSSRASYAVRLDRGLGAGASGPTDRRMTNGGRQLRYGLYQNAARTAPWGDGPDSDVDMTGNGLDQVFAVYGRIFAGQPRHGGLYTDSVLITVEY